jgi:TM2 domain-containing membrane protein YozV
MYARPTGFGDVASPTAMASVLTGEFPPPPPPPGTELPSPAEPSLVPAASTLLAAPEVKPRSRLVFILLGIFLGSFGIHNFYAGYVKRGVAQLALTLCTLFYGSVFTWVWALVEVCTVDRDKNNISFG